MGGLESSSDLQIPKPLSQTFGDHLMNIDYNWHHRYLHAIKFFQLSDIIQLFVNFFILLSLNGLLEEKNPMDDKLFFLC